MSFSKKRAIFTVVMGFILIFLIFYIHVHFARADQKINDFDFSDQPTLGKSTAPVKMIIFEDFKCKNCGQFFNSFFEKIKKIYIDTGILQYTFIPVAFLPASIEIANISYCLFDQKDEYFFAFTKKIFREKNLSIEQMINLSQSISNNINLEHLKSCVNEKKFYEKIKNNFFKARCLMGGIVSTPSVWINETKIFPLNWVHVQGAIAHAVNEKLKRSVL